MEEPRTGRPLRVGDLVYHGTSTPIEFTDLRGPAWVSDSRRVAEKFVGWHAGTRPRVITYRVIDQPKMALIDTPGEFEELAEWASEETGLHAEDMHEIADAVCSARLDGWHSARNYPEGSDTLICDPERFLEYVKEEPVAAKKNPPKATAAMKKVRRLVGPAPLCYPAAEVVYHAGGGQRAGLTPVQQEHEGVSHWWVRGPKGEVLDPAAAQFSRPVPYERGRGRGFLTAKPSLRAKALAGLAGVKMKNPAHFLDTVDSAIAWGLENIDDAEHYIEASTPELTAEFRRRHRLEIAEYVAEYHKVMREGKATIWRGLVIPQDVDPRKWIKWEGLGIYWSFRRSGANEYGGDAASREPERGLPKIDPNADVCLVVVKAVVDASDIDWEHGFHSFWTYGTEQFECALKEGAKVKILSIDDRPVRRLAATANPVRDVHYLNVVTAGPLVIVRVPWPTPPWRSILKALTGVMAKHGLRQKDVLKVEGLTPDPGEPWDSEQHAMAILLDAAFAGDRERFKRFWLYDWRNGAFELVRRVVT